MTASQGDSTGGLAARFQDSSEGPEKQSLLAVDVSGINALLAPSGMPAFRGRQIVEWLYQKRKTDFAQMTNLSAGDRTWLAENFRIYSGEQVRQLTATDGTQKLLVRWRDGGLTETVMIPCDDDDADDYGRTIVKHRRTACLSTQVGCPVGCAFCASGLAGLKRNLAADEIIEQALRLSQMLPAERRLTNVVFMGMGEPLANFDAAVAAIRVLMAPWAFNISARKITVSTVGLPPQIRKLADVGLPVTLAISLHAPNDALRREIIPWAKGIGVDELVQAGKYYFDKTGREVTLEYIMLDGVNTLPEHARELAAVSRRLRANVNLIYYNEVPELSFKRPAGTTMLTFQNILRQLHVNAHVRKSRGREIAAACGQLARQDRQMAEAK
ncbi:MAG: 23S rRNA (adenine(2503)-C(2))-methyltransferase RlmN [Phycisphaerales bacterium]|nr:23S rRNA (adenine(2503)-C(2))-methyltransferase RlmN [Phycisphaerales bacterium]